MTGARSDLRLYVSDPPLHVLSSAWLSVKFFLSPQQREPHSNAHRQALGTSRLLQIRTSPRLLSQALWHPSLLWFSFFLSFFWGGESPGQKLTDSLKETLVCLFPCLCFIPSPWLQADPHSYGNDSAVPLTTFYWKESALGRRGGVSSFS